MTDTPNPKPPLTPKAAAVSAAIAELMDTRERLSILTLPSSRIQLRVRPVARGAMERALAGVESQAPKPPMVHIEEKGRDEPNPSDPAYLKAANAWAQDVMYRALKVYLLAGTIFVSAPEGFYGPADQGWVDELQLMGVDVSDIPPHPAPGRSDLHPARYLAWAENYALRDDLDMAFLFMAAREVMGTKEEAVQNAAEWFWRDTIRDLGLEPAAPG